jgi:hypothetical protein
MKKKINLKELSWAGYSLAIALLIHFFAPGYLFVQFFKYAAIVGFLINLCSAFNIKVPYISDNRKLPKKYAFFAGLIFFILYLSYLFYFNK